MLSSSIKNLKMCSFCIYSTGPQKFKLEWDQISCRLVIVQVLSPALFVYNKGVKPDYGDIWRHISKLGPSQESVTIFLMLYNKLLL